MANCCVAWIETIERPARTQRGRSRDYAARHGRQAARHGRQIAASRAARSEAMNEGPVSESRFDPQNGCPVGGCGHGVSVFRSRRFPTTPGRSTLPRSTSGPDGRRRSGWPKQAVDHAPFIVIQLGCRGSQNPPFAEYGSTTVLGGSCSAASHASSIEMIENSNNSIKKRIES